MKVGEGVGVYVFDGTPVTVGVSGTTLVLVGVGGNVAGGSSTVGYGDLVGKGVAAGSAAFISCGALLGCVRGVE